MTVGLPQSGKSTWARSIGYPIVNPDSIRLAFHGKPFLGLAEPFVWAIAKVMVRALFLAGHDTVILDATNTTRSRRDEWKSTAWEREYYVFDTPKRTCIARADLAAAKNEISDDHHRGLITAIERMAGHYEPVGNDEWDVG